MAMEGRPAMATAVCLVMEQFQAMAVLPHMADREPNRKKQKSCA